ncbi:hypothetical protein MHYP_G00273010 [Metynnis hypsauchen]
MTVHYFTHGSVPGCHGRGLLNPTPSHVPRKTRSPCPALRMWVRPVFLEHDATLPIHTFCVHKISTGLVPMPTLAWECTDTWVTTMLWSLSVGSRSSSLQPCPRSCLPWSFPPGQDITHSVNTKRPNSTAAPLAQTPVQSRGFPGMGT